MKYIERVVVDQKGKSERKQNRKASPHKPMYNNNYMML